MTQEHKQRFGEVLRVVRKGKHLKLRELAALGGVSEASVSSAETGPHAIFGLKKLKLMCEKLELDELMTNLLVRLHGECPKSDFQVRQEERWAKYKENRKIFKNAAALESELELAKCRIGELEALGSGGSTAMRDALIYVLDMAVLDEGRCGCDPNPSHPEECCLCGGMRALGAADAWLDHDQAGAALAALPGRNPRPPPSPVNLARITETMRAAWCETTLPDSFPGDSEPASDFG